ncbi:MAG: GGDEF domain-containing response regulator [Chloroflexi bacterium]|nr:GGDEF domain-containing response regulator [Chloroflexota bacterium]MCI0575368.1 GGDEF domain-containing response regulator [Chloroflexota bacterium]MCI0646384.1 GGDEF domain-containing response regulator [Chloroflexota bacterium]MCI0728358.1 GGDEF domain-containing response regulator [Chloroflexota bacterium]
MQEQGQAVKRTKVLLVEDHHLHAALIKRMFDSLAAGEFELLHVELLERALELLDREPIDVVLLDLNLPDSRGYNTFRRMQEHVLTVPIILLTATHDEGIAQRAIQEGAQDYMVKGETDVNVMVRAVRYAIERHHLQSQLRNLSLTDDLTGLYNRRGFLTLAEQHVRLARRTGQGFFVVFVDLDGLKRINDTYGHAEGDTALTATADILRHSFRESDIISRMSGGADEFVVLAVDADPGGATIIRQRLLEKVAAFNQKGLKPYPLSVSIGLAYYDPADPAPLQKLLDVADEALYIDKHRKKEKR